LTDSRHQHLVTIEYREVEMRTLVLFLLIALILNLASQDNSDQEDNIFQLVITGFIEASNLQEAGAEKGDILLEYNGERVNSLAELTSLKQNLTTDNVIIKLLRNEKELVVTIPAGPLGCFLREYLPDHEVLTDAVIIEGLGKLDWGIGMENSFLGCVTLLEKNFGNNLSYSDLVGLSAYGFRTHFYGNYCPSSPDATVGRDVGAELLKTLGYEFDYIFLEDVLETDSEYQGFNKTDMLKKIMESIDKGFPVIGIDLIEVPEWGLITGYQNNGQDLFCRTYYDRTRGYDKVQKFPWVIILIKDKKRADLYTAYDAALTLAKEMYETEYYGDYFSGIRAYEEWIKILADDEFYTNLDVDNFNEAFQANWWIMYSLKEAKFNAVKFLKNNKAKFLNHRDIIIELVEIYQKEVELLKAYVEKMPSPNKGNRVEDWQPQHRNEQREILILLLELEKKVLSLLQIRPLEY